MALHKGFTGPMWVRMDWNCMESQVSTVADETWGSSSLTMRMRGDGSTGCGKTRDFGWDWGKLPSGAKARADPVGFMRGLKPPPPSASSFSAACLEAGRGGAGRDAADFGSAGFSVCGGAEQGSFALKDDADRHIDEQLA